MHYLYILKNKQTGKHYIGSTNNLERRIREHRLGKVRTTRILKTFELVYTETYNTIEEARLREKKLKSYKNATYFEKLINRAGSSTGRANPF